MPFDPRSRSLRRAIIATISLLAMSTEARAHFLFVRIGPVAEGGRSAEVYFSEFAKAGDPRFIPKITHTKLWIQTNPGEFRELKVQAGADRLRAILPSAKSLAVIGECRYGVLARPKQTPFLLRHYPKAVAGSAEEIGRFPRKREIPFEIVAKIVDGGSATGSAKDQAGSSRIHLTALRNGKAMPGVEFHSVASDLTEVKFPAGPDGSATWSPPSPGQYCFYVADTLKESGDLDGKHYDEVRDFATLTIEWPLDTSSADPDATAIFRKAIARRAQWRDFPGFSADISGDLDGRPFSGKVTVRADGTAKITVDDAAAKPWLRDQFDSLVTHRLPAPEAPKTSSTSQNGDLGFSLRFGDDADEHPLGRLLIVNGGRMASSYRIKDDQISVVNRNLGGQSMTLYVLDNQVNREGLTLPRNYVVSYWEGDSGRLSKSETFQDQWTRIDAWDLPSSHTAANATDAGMSIRTLTLSGHAMLKTP